MRRVPAPDLAVGVQQALPEHAAEPDERAVCLGPALGVGDQNLTDMIRMTDDVEAAVGIRHVVDVAERFEAPADDADQVVDEGVEAAQASHPAGRRRWTGRAYDVGGRRHAVMVLNAVQPWVSSAARRRPEALAVCGSSECVHAELNLIPVVGWTTPK